MASEQEERKVLKVVDRRRFTADGDVRSGPDVSMEPPVRHDPPPAPPKGAPRNSREGAAVAADTAPKAPRPDAKQAPAAAAPQPTPEEEAPGGLSFSMFLQSLAQQALMQLGLMAWPHGQRELHLDQARDTIDIVALLKTKTRNNLNAEEQQLMDTVLYELKMSFVEVQQAIARSKGAASPLPRPPGPPGR